jgi:hypothetical protein
VAEGVEEGGGAVAVEFVGGGADDGGSGGVGVGDSLVDVGDFEAESDGGAILADRADTAEIGEFIGEVEEGAADLHFGVADAPGGIGEAVEFDGGEGVAVEVEGLSGVAAAEVWSESGHGVFFIMKTI